MPFLHIERYESIAHCGELLSATRGVLFVLKTPFFAKKIQKHEILPCNKLLFSLSVQNEEIPYKNSGFGNFFVRNSLFLEFLRQTNLRVSEIIPQPLAGYKKRGTLALCRRAQRYISGHNTTAMRPLGRYGTDVCLRHCLFLYPAGATGFLKAFQNAELPAYAVPCRRCLSEDVDIFQKSAERQGESGHDVRVSRLSTWMSTVGGPVMTRTTHHFSQKIHIRRPYIETCVSHAPGVRLV